MDEAERNTVLSFMTNPYTHTEEEEYLMPISPNVQISMLLQEYSEAQEALEETNPDFGKSTSIDDYRGEL